VSQCELQTTYQIGPPARPGSPAKGQGKVDGLSTAAARAPLDGSIELAERKAARQLCALATVTRSRHKEGVIKVAQALDQADTLYFKL
jgi:hypothetical protein